MAEYIDLEIPFVSQMDIGIHTGTAGHSEKTGCWYASTCMVSYFWETGPRLGVPDLYAGTNNPKGISATHYPNLISNEGFKSYPVPTNNQWTIEELYNVVKTKGPCYVRRGYRNAEGRLTGGHAIVLKGANKTTQQVAFLDPAVNYTKPVKFLGKTLIKSKHEGRKVYSLEEVNSFFKFDGNRQYSLMYKDPDHVTNPETYIGWRRLSRWE